MLLLPWGMTHGQGTFDLQGLRMGMNVPELRALADSADFSFGHLGIDSTTEYAMLMFEDSGTRMLKEFDTIYSHAGSYLILIGSA